ncbi:TPA: glycosyltransferase family 2 protein, partial [Streptococcus suis]|nr:glycosyltransferase family 2 protein [Streptococcus suis]
MVGVSIIIPIYNVEDYLIQCLESIVNQTYTNINVILVNDGSTDSSGEICEMYANKFDFITAYHKENGGLISAWKYGLSHVTTDIISFVDPDDWINETYYEVLMNKFLEFDADIITSRVMMDFGASQEEIQYKIHNGLFVGKILDENIKSVFLSQGGFMDRVIPVTRWAKLIKKDLIENNLKYLNEKITYGEDLNIILPAILDSKRVYIHNEGNATYYYRVRKDSMQHSYDRNKLFSVNEVYSSLMNIALEKNRNELRTQILTDYIC